MIRLAGITKIYGARPRETVGIREVSLNVERGEAVAVVGPSGSGKTTLLDIVGTLTRPTSGLYTLDGRDVFAGDGKKIAGFRNRTFGFIFQSFHLIPTWTVLENVALPFQYSDVPRPERHTRAFNALRSVDLSHKAEAQANQLSGGECQRAAIARALVTDPLVLLADEPTGNLDTHTGGIILDLLFQFWERGRTLIMITHNEELARRFPRVLRLCDGQVTADLKTGDDPGCDVVSENKPLETGSCA